MIKDFVIIEFNDKGTLVSTAPMQKLFRGLEKGKYILEISKAGKRSNQQNRFYWGLVIPMIQKGIYDKGTDLTREETHELLKAEFNFDELVNQDTGQFVKIPRSTTRLNKQQFSHYIDKIQQFASEFLGIVIPEAGEQQMINYDLEEGRQ